MAQGFDLGWNYQHVSEVFEKMRHVMPNIAGISWQRLEHEGAVITRACMKKIWAKPSSSPSTSQLATA
jgi:formate dehydrogenase major subunit